MSKDSEYVDLSNFLNILKNSYRKIREFRYLEHSLVGLVAILALFLRTRNLTNLQGKYLMGLDPYLYLRLSREVLEQGSLPVLDVMRNPPFGFERGFDLFPYFLAYWSKLLSLFGLSQEAAHILYPPIIMALSLIPFYLFVRNVLSKKVALLSILFLSIIPGYLFRTASGFADHESLAMLFFFGSMYLFSRGLDFKSNKKYAYGFSSGLLTFLLIISWIAYPFALIVMSMFLLFKLFFSKLDLKYYLSWFLTFAILSLISGKFDAGNIGIIFTIGTFGVLIMNEFLNKYKFNIPSQVAAVILTGFFGLIINSVLKIVDIGALLFNILHAGGTSKVDFTTSEISSSFVMSGNGYFSSYGYLIFLAIAGLFILTLALFKNLENKSKWIVSLLTAGSISLILLGNWSSKLSIMKNSYVHFMVAISILFLIYYSYLFYSNQYSKISNISNSKLLLILAFFVSTGLLARTGIRFMFLFGPAVVILASYALVDIYEHMGKIRFGKIAMFIVIFILSLNLTSAVYQQSSGMGSSLPGQWENSMNWINSETPEDSVFVHWWDYGYWTQTIGNRVSVSDGGRAGGELGLYTLARYGMTNLDLNESREYFKSRGVTHLLYSSEEIGKYPAFAYIGSDKDYDRKSAIGTFGLAEINEVRKGNKLTYHGRWNLDSIIIDDKKIISAGNGYISEINVYIDETGVYAPATTTVISNGYQKEFEIGCVYIHDILFELEGNLNSCIKIIPAIAGDNIHDFGALLYLSEKVKDGIFTKLYLHSEKLEGFNQVYTDNQPLALYRGAIIGPIKIWDVIYSGSEQNVGRFLDFEMFESVYPDHGINTL